jgi:hypothetical protein
MFTLTHRVMPSVAEIANQVLGLARDSNRDRGGRHVTHKPVLGGSKRVGSFQEEAFMARLDDATRQACRRAVNEAFERGRALLAELRRQPRALTPFEHHCTRITGSAIRVYEALLRMEKRFRGRVFPSYEMIAEWATVSRATVARALDALTQIGLLSRLRRYIQTKDDQIGARSEQTSNAYRMELPKTLRELIQRRFRPAPLPVDEAQLRRERLADHAHMLASLSRAEYLRATTTDAALADSLVGVWEALGRRDM